MGVHRILDQKRDFHPIEEAAQIINKLTGPERNVPPLLQWSYVMLCDKRQPGKACIQVFNEDNKFLGYWYS